MHPVRALFICLILAGQITAQSTGPDSTEAPPSRVRYRSTAEELISLPGMVVYLPCHLFFSAGKYTVHAIWNERLLDRAKAWLTTADGRAGIRPLSSTSIGTGGHVFYNNLLLGANSSLTSSWGSSGTQRQNHLFVLSWPGGHPLPGALKFTTQFNKGPKESFYGIGHDTRKADRTSFLQEDLHARLKYQHRLNREFAFGAELTYRSVDIREGLSKSAPTMHSQHAPEHLPGLGAQVRYLGTAATLRTSFVDVPGSPTRGNRSLLHLRYSHSVDDTLSHLSVLALTEQFFELFYRRTFSLRLGTEWRLAPGDDETPFYELATLGGTEFLRGYRRGRFRDRGTTFATGTYKFPIWKLLDGTLFYETGRTFHKLEKIALVDWKSTYGGGLRVWVPEGIVFEQVIARSSDEIRLLFNFNTLF